MGKCRECGCTNQSACITEEGPCWWVDQHKQDLCSACEYKLNEEHSGEDEIPTDLKQWITDSNTFTDKEQKILLEEFAAYFRKRKERLNRRCKIESSN